MSPRIRVRVWLIGVLTALVLIAVQGFSLRVSAFAEADAEEAIEVGLSAIVRADAQLASSAVDVTSGRLATGKMSALQIPAGLQQAALGHPEARAWIERVGYILTSIPTASVVDTEQTLTDARQHLRKASALLQADQARHAGSRAGLWNQLSRLAMFGYIIVFAGSLGAYLIAQLPSTAASHQASLEEMLAVSDRAVQAALAIRPAVGSRRGIEVAEAVEAEAPADAVDDVIEEELEEAVAEDVAEDVETETSEAVERTEHTPTEVHIGADVLTTLRHELRTPLSVILGYASELETELTGEHQEFVQAIRSGGERLFETLESLMKYAEIEGNGLSQSPERLDVHGTVEKVLKDHRPTAFEKRLNLMYRATPEATWVDVDPAALETAISHLVRNAIKFTESGLIVVGVEAEPETVRITVADTGPGISDADIDRVLQPFSQQSTGDSRQHEGLGLGLTISAHLVRANGGQMEVESVPGEGSKFSIVLPRKLAPETTLRRAA